MNAPLRILHLEDSPYDAELIHETLVTEGIDHVMVNVDDRPGFLTAIEQGQFDLIIADFALPSFDGQTALTIAQEKRPDIPFIFVSGAIGEERAIESLKLGATDYVLKHRLSRLVPAIQRALREVEGRQQRQQREEQLRQSRNQLRAILQGITEGITVQRPDGSLIYANEMAAQLAGYSSVQAFMEAPVTEITRQFELRDEAGDPFPINQLPGRLALQGQPSPSTLIRFCPLAGGEERWSIVSATPIFDEQGQVQFAVNIFRDVTERTRLYEAEREARQQAEATAIRIASLQVVTASLTEALTPLQVAQVVEEETMAVIGAQAAATVLLRESDAGPMLEVLHSLGYRKRQIASLRQFSLDAPFPIAEAVRSGQPQFIPSRVLAQASFPDFVARVAPEFNAWATLPLTIEGRIIGGMVLSFHQEQKFDTEDQAFLFSLARQCAQALERARLYEAERQARQLAEDAADRITGLQRVTSALSQALTPNQVARFVIEEGMTVLGAKAGTVVALNEKEAMLDVLFASGYEREVMERWNRFPVSAPVPIAAVVRTGNAVLLPSSAEGLKQFPIIEQDIRLSGNQAWAAIPLLIEGRTIGALGLSFAEPQNFDQDDETFMLALGRQCAQALERARLYEAERVARTEATRLNEVLEQRVAQRTEQLRWLTHQVVTAQEAERHRISRELHDEAGQALTALRINLGLIQEDLPNELSSLKQRMAEAVRLTGEAMEQIRNLAHDLRPPSLDTVGLDLTLEGFCREFAQRTQLTIRYQGTDLPDLPEPVSTTFYRLLQEALTNVARHAQARNVQVVLEYDGDQLSLMIADDGQGFAEKRETVGRKKGLGLLGMQERLELLNGWLEIDSQPGQGTRLTAYVSL